MAKISFYEIASVLVEHNGLTHSKATAFVKTLFDIIQERLPIDQQVKIKGLGTFKIVLVEDRESINVNTGERILIEGHSKITFTPDTAMKELINKPFSQFETVILKDGIAFEEPKVNEKKTVEKVAAKDIELDVLLDTIAEPVDSVVEDYIPAPEDYLPVEEIATPVEETAAPVEEIATPVEEIAAPVEEAVASVEEIAAPVEEIAAPVEEIVAPVEETATPAEEEIVVPPVIEEETPVNEDTTIINFIPSTETAPEPVVDQETSIDEQEDMELEDTEEYEESPSRLKSILLHILYIVVIAALSAYGGYWYGVKKHQLKVISELNLTENTVEPETENVIIEDTVSTDTLKSRIVAEKDVTTANEKHTDKESVKPVQPVAEPASAIKSEPADFDSGKYAAMDARVRTGAYIIVGEDRTVTVKKGETLPQLARRVLGEGMECYIEVFNGISARTELQEGQKIKIPKLKLKKKKTNTPQPNTPQPNTPQP